MDTEQSSQGCLPLPGSSFCSQYLLWLQVPKVPGVPHLGARVAHLLRLASRWGAIGSRHSEKGPAAPSGSSPAPERPSSRSSPGGGSPSSNDSHSHERDNGRTPCNGATECQTADTEITAEKKSKEVISTA